MIFINNSADYSACGIGKAPIISDEVKQLLSGFNNLTNSEMFAFQNLLDAIGGTNGVIWAAIDNLYIPAFADVLKDCFFNIKTGQIEYSGSITDADVSTYYNMTEYGVKLISAGNATPFTFPNAGKTNLDCLLFAVSTPVSTGYRYIWGPTDDAGTSSTGTALKNNTFKRSANVQMTNSAVDLMFLSSTTNEAVYNRINSSSLSSTTSVTLSNFSVIIGVGPQVANVWPGSYKIFGFGDGLSAANAATLGNAIRDFNTALAQ